MSQQQLAKRLGRSQSFVAKIETGNRRVDVIEFATIAIILNWDAEAMIRALTKRAIKNGIQP